LDIVALEEGALRSQSIDAGRFNVIDPVAAEFRAEIVHADQQNVRRLPHGQRDNSETQPEEGRVHDS
jgi:hypothetical protein